MVGVGGGFGWVERKESLDSLAGSNWEKRGFCAV
jgi:hypothetical protein